MRRKLYHKCEAQVILYQASKRRQISYRENTETYFDSNTPDIFMFINFVFDIWRSWLHFVLQFTLWDF